MPFYLKVLLGAACIAAVADIAWVIAFQFGKFRGSLEQAFYKELFLRRALLRLPGSLAGFLGISILYVGASSERPSTALPLLLDRVGFFVGLLCIAFSILAIIWYLTQFPVPLFLVPKWARPEIRDARARRARERSER